MAPGLHPALPLRRGAAWRPLAVALALAAGLGSAALQAAPFAYITNQGSHDVSVIDLARQAVVATVPVGRSPAGVVAVSASARVYVSNPDSRTVSVIDMRRNQVVGTWPAGQAPVGIDASPDGRTLLVADWQAQQLLVYDTSAAQAAPGTGALPSPPITTIAVGRAPSGVVAHARLPLAFLAERDDDRIAVIDLVNRRVLARVAVGSHPFALLHDAARERLYALNVQSNDVSVVDTRDAAQPRLLATLAVGKAPYGAALALGGQLLYVTNQHDDTVSVVDLDRLQVRHTVPGFGYPEGVAVHGDRVYVVNWMDDNVAVLDAATGRMLTTIATGRNSRGFGAFIGAPPGP